MCQASDFHEEYNGVMALARELALPEPVLVPLAVALETLPPAPVDALASPETAGAIWAELTAGMPSWQENDGMPQLAITLAAACRVREAYRKNRIPEDVYLATMGCFARFLRETRELTGRWAFDRGFWTWRQTSGVLFRLGTLEFEYRVLGDIPLPEGLSPEDPILSVHIPSDAVLSREELDRSYRWAGEFFRDHKQALCRYGLPKAVLCGSWLMAPALDGLLADGSGIRRLAGDYTRYYVREEDQSFYRWLFGGFAPVGELPERTGLQRAVKAHLTAGGKIGMAYGILRGSVEGTS